MVKKAEKEQMRQFVTDRLEDSQRYNILESANSHILIVQRPDIVENPSQLYIVLHNVKMTIRDYKRLVAQNNHRNIKTSNVFYKDGEIFHVRLGARGNFKGDERALKDYSKEEIDKMLHLRGLEKEVLERQHRKHTLVYFQPQTARLEESLRGYDMLKVILDYSHVDIDHRSYGFVENRESIDYKIAEEIFTIKDGSVIFYPVNQLANMLILSPPREKK